MEVHVPERRVRALGVREDDDSARMRVRRDAAVVAGPAERATGAAGDQLRLERAAVASKDLHVDVRGTVVHHRPDAARAAVRDVRVAADARDLRSLAAALEPDT